MKEKHPHYDTIVAWAEGKAVQVWCTGDRCWYDWTYDCAPSFYHDNMYRVKPETIRYRTFLIRTISDERPHVVSVTEEANKEYPRDKWDQFVRWLGDWQEIEV